MTTPRRILAVRLQGLGDVLMATPALRSLKTTWPEAELTLLVGRQAAPAAATSTRIDRLITIDERAFFAPRPLALLFLVARLRTLRFDKAVLFSRSQALRQFARLAGARGIFDIRRLEEDGRQLPVYEAAVGLELARAAGARPGRLEMEFPISASAYAHSSVLLGASSRGEWLAVAPGGGENAAWRMPQKRWKPEGFRAVVESLSAEHRLRAVLLGGPADRMLGAQVAAAGGGRVVDLTGRTDLETTAALISRARLLITNDSVAMHLGILTGTPTVALFGPTHPPALLPPDCHNVQVVVPEAGCRPCFWQARDRLHSARGWGRFEPCSCFPTSCLEAVSVESVLAAGRQLLLRHPGP